MPSRCHAWTCVLDNDDDQRLIYLEPEAPRAPQVVGRAPSSKAYVLSMAILFNFSSFYTEVILVLNDYVAIIASVEVKLH